LKNEPPEFFSKILFEYIFLKKCKFWKEKTDE